MNDMTWYCFDKMWSFLVLPSQVQNVWKKKGSVQKNKFSCIYYTLVLHCSSSDRILSASSLSQKKQWYTWHNVKWRRWHQLNSARNPTRHCLIVLVDLEILHSWIDQTFKHEQTDQTQQTSQLLSSSFLQPVRGLYQHPRCPKFRLQNCANWK